MSVGTRTVVLERVRPTEDAVLEMVRNHYSHQSNVKARPRTVKTSKTWWPNRAYTYVDPGEVSANPGYCYKLAGWTNVRLPNGEIHKSKDGKHLLEKVLAGRAILRSCTKCGAGFWGWNQELCPPCWEKASQKKAEEERL